METEGPAADKSLSPPGADYDKLRQLRDRAHAALADQRRHMQQLEKRIVSQLEAVATEIAEDLASQCSDESTTNPAHDDRDTLHRERVDWQAEQELAEAQMQTQLEQLRARDYELSQREQQLEVRWLEMTDQQEELDERLAASKASSDELQAEHERLQAERAEFETKQGELAAREQQLAEREAELTRLGEEAEAERQTHDERQAELERRGAELDEQAAQLEERQQQLDEAQQALEQSQQEIEQSQQELDDERAALAEGRDAKLGELQQHQAEREQAHQEEVARLTAELEEARNALQQSSARLTELESQAAAGGEVAAEWQQKLAQAEAEWESQREKFVDERDKLSAALEHTKRELDEARESRSDDELEDLSHKFQLAMDDVHALRQQVADLEQQLAHRPESDGADPAELVQLREERDQLMSRLEELEQRQAEAGGGADDEQFADLQRRFEMAVQDVRELRAQNAQLEQRLESQAAKGSVGSVDSGELDWESQKRRLLASLEGEEDFGEPERVEERTTIEGTIRITDEVVAEKDRLIAELEQKLQAAAEQPAGEPSVETEREAILDTDEVIRAEREKITQLEAQLNEALRKAELELSVERAKIARERTRMEELQQELESIRREGGTPDRPGGKGRGRWLSKLGLSGDDPPE